MPRRRTAARKVAEATAALARMINAARPEELVIGPSTTFLLQQLARGMAPGFRPGDEIVVTNVDHESNIGPWRELEAQRRGDPRVAGRPRQPSSWTSRDLERLLARAPASSA